MTDVAFVAANPAPRTIAVLTSFRAFTASSSRLPSSLIGSAALAVQAPRILSGTPACAPPRATPPLRRALGRSKPRMSSIAPFSSRQKRGASLAEAPEQSHFARDPRQVLLHAPSSTAALLSTECDPAGAPRSGYCWSGGMKTAEVPHDLLRRASLQGGLLSRQQLVTGGVTRHRLVTLLKYRALVHVTRNVYEWPGATGESSALRSVSKYDLHRIRSAWTGLLSAEGAVATGAAALALHGAWGLPPRITPEISLRGRNKSAGANGVRVRQFARPFPVSVIHGRHAAAPEAALIQALPELGFRRAIGVVDSALNKGLIAPVHIEQIREGLRGRRGVARLGRWWEFVDGRAESRMETWAHQDCLEASLQPPTEQAEIRDIRAAFIARADLGWQRECGTCVLVELDGKEFHETPRALFQDRIRQNRIVLEGRHTVLHFTGRDVREGTVARAVSRALQS